jgi:hypothetical protein
MEVIWVRREAKYFCRQNWTAQISLNAQENLAWARKRIWLGNRSRPVARGRFFVVTGLVPAIHVFFAWMQLRRGCPAQGCTRPGMTSFIGMPNLTDCFLTQTLRASRKRASRRMQPNWKMHPMTFPRDEVHIDIANPD